MSRFVVMGIAALSVMLGTAATADAHDGCCPTAYTSVSYASDACCPTETSCDPCVYRETFFPRIYRARFCGSRCTPVSCCPDPCETTACCPPTHRGVRFRRTFFRQACCPRISWCPTDPCEEEMIEAGSGETTTSPEMTPMEEEEEEEPPSPAT